MPERLLHTKTTTKPSNNAPQTEDMAEMARGALHAGSVASTWPGLPIDLTSQTHASLIDSLVEVAGDYRSHHSYATVRERFVHLSLALNQFRLLAPAFRDQPRIPPVKARNAGHIRLLIDQVVIDCHWLYCQGEKVDARWRELRNCFDRGRSFDCVGIEERLAARTWSKDFRTTDMLLLTNRQQVQLVQLCSSSVRAQRQQVLDGLLYTEKGERIRSRALVTSVRLAINNWADNVHQIRGHQDMYEALWVARKLLGPKSKNTQIAVLAGLYCGRKPLSPRTVADKFVNLDRELDAAGVTSTATIFKYGKAIAELPKVDTSALRGWVKHAMDLHNISES